MRISPIANGTWNNNPTMVLYLSPTSSTFNVNGIAKTPIAPKNKYTYNDYFACKTLNKEFFNLENSPKPVMNLVIVKDIYSGMNELMNIPPPFINNAINEVFFLPILSARVPKT